MPKRSRRAQQTATASTPEGELQRHLKDLGLDSVDAYRTWCRAHGFGSAIHKSWQERRAETRFARKQETQNRAAADLQKHAEALGLSGVTEYPSWCSRHGFSDSLHKTREQKRREQEVASRERAERTLAGARQQARRPDDAIRALYAGAVGAEQLKTPHMRQIAAVFDRTPRE